ncbi:MAG TPA: DMT family transporter [Gammaproteobacteria bacterium]|nr:DMT family transporter [Gammaproteobacteria bacterium]
MTLTFHAAALVLLAALFHASWNALVKTSGDRLAVLAMVNGVGSVFAMLALPFVEVPARESWIYLGASIVLHSGYYFFLIGAYRVGDLSHVYPLARGLSPLLVAGAAAVFAGETLAFVAFVGVLLACAGIVSLSFDGGLPWRSDRRPLLFALGTAVFIAAYTIVDGIGVRAAGSVSGYIAWLFALDAIPIVLVACLLRRRELRWTLRTEWKNGVVGGVLALAAYGLVIWAMSLAAMAAVSALRETSVIFAALIGTVLLKERFGKLRLSAAALVAAGVVLMNLARA